jgi:DNA-binding NtrC family response regulator
VRELRNAIEHGRATLQGDEITLANLPAELRARPPPRAPEAIPANRAERQRRQNLEALQACGDIRRRGLLIQ